MSLNPFNKTLSTATKRPRYDESLQGKSVDKDEAVDPFDDCFTGEELLELELVATQVENQQLNKNNIGSVSFNANACTASLKPENSMLANLKSGQYSEKNVLRLNDIINEKSGEILLLRDKLRDAERLLHSERHAKMIEEKGRREEKSQREVELQKKVVIFHDRLEFKNAELQEAHQIIKNLEIKIKEFPSSYRPPLIEAPSAAFDQKESSLKKLKFVKPESPLIVVKKDAKETPLTIPEIQFKEDKVEPTIQQRCLSVTLKSNLDTGLIPLTQHHAFHKLNGYCLTYARSSVINLHDATQRLLRGQVQGEPASLDDDVARIASFALCALSRCPRVKSSCQRVLGYCFCDDFVSGLPGTRQFVCDCLQGLDELLHYFDGVALAFMVEDVMKLFTNLLDDTQHVGDVLQIVEKLVDKSTPAQLRLFHPIIGKLSLVPESNARLTHFLCHCLPHCELIELIVVPSSEQDISLLQKVCQSLKSQKDFPSFGLLQKGLHFLSALVYDYDVILARHGCFPQVFHSLFSIFSVLFDHHERTAQRSQLLGACAYAIYICATSELEVVRTHKQFALLEKLEGFLQTQPKSLWSNDLKRVLCFDVKV